MVVGIIIVVVFIIIVAIVFIGIYNRLVVLRNNIKKSWSNIDVLLKQRSDELPKLIETVKGYMKHEKSTLEELTKARTAIMGATSMKEKAAADNQISGALKTLFAVSENYPVLKANENFKQLQERISSLEDQIADRREFYNDSVNTWNIRIQTFPDMMVAGMMHAKEEELFKALESERQDVKVQF